MTKININIQDLDQRAPLSLVEECRGFALIGWILVIRQLLCHKDTAQGWYFLPFAVSLWDKDGFHAQKGSIIDTVTGKKCPSKCQQS